MRRDHLSPLISASEGACAECWSCARECPARAIRISSGHPEVVQERCVACGLCVSACGNGGYRVRDDTGAVRDLLASGRPVVAVVASEFVAAMHPLRPEDVESRLEAVGFYAVEGTVLGEELVAIAYEQRHTAGTGIPVIRSTCPVVGEWVRRFHPGLSAALAPVVPPYAAQARLVKALYPAGTAVVYVSPCYARKDEALDPGLEGAVDAAIDFTELARLLRDAAPPPGGELERGGRRPEPLKELSLTDGYPRATLEARDLTTSDVQIVRGLRALDRLLRAIEAGETAPPIIDALNCEGCIDGPAVSPGISLFAKRNIDAAEREQRPRSAVSTRELMRHLPTIDIVRSFTPRSVARAEVTPDQVAAALLEAGLQDPDAPDCGACGYATCAQHAVAVIEGVSSWDMCFPLQRRLLARSMAELEETATRDSLTGLSNRRALSERLTAEIARFRRYGTPVSLLMLDLDGFKSINDAHGHPTGDAVLEGVAGALRSSLRETDLAARYGGDEFAVVLPGIGKTDAFAVAEKLRATVAGLEVPVCGDGDRGPVVTRVSIGVSTAGESSADPGTLIEAADRALYRAKDGGRDRVHLAPG